MTGKPERREFPRVALDVVLMVELAHGPARARIVNLGEQGLRMLVDGPVPPKRGDEVLVELFLPDQEKPVRALGWVTNSTGLGSQAAVSLTFFSLEEADARRIRAVVAAAERP